MPNPSRTARPQDFLLTALFVAMALIRPEHDPSEIVLVLLLGALQITESRLIPLETVRGNVVWNLAKLVAGYLLIGYTGGVISTYYLVLLFPVISAAATLGVISTLAFTGLACGAYLSFLLYIDWTQWDMHQDQIEELVRRLVFLAISGLLVNTLAEAIRAQSIRYKALAEQLAASNRSLREAQRQVLRAERLAALGQLTAGLAHELRNPLGTIKASADMLDRKLGEADAIARELAGYISSEVDRTNSLVSRFLDFARPLELRREPGNLNDVVVRAVTGTEREQKSRGVAVETELAATPLVFSLDEQLMERVFLNLLLNAIQASARGGSVCIIVRPGGEEAVVEVIDRGSGITPENAEAIFNPFFTTKSDGTGLGLAIVAKIVDEHGGKIRVESAPGEGATFRVSIPLREQT